MRSWLGAIALGASLLAACSPSVGDAYQHAFAAGQRAYHAGRYDEAVKHFEHAAKNATRVKDRDEALFLVARMHEKLGATDDAKAALDKLSTTSPDGPRAGRAAFERALLEVETGDAEKGYVMLLDAAFTYPKNGSARRALRLCIEHQQDRGGDEAVVAWLDGPGKTLRTTELQQDVDYEKALALDRLGRTAEARDLLLKTAREHPYPYGTLTDDAYWHASIMEEKLGHYEAAIAHLRTMLSTRESSYKPGSNERPRYPASQLRIAELYRDKLHDHPAARREFHKLFTDFPTSTFRDDALWSEARLAHDDGDTKEACRLVERLQDDLADSRYARCAHLLCTTMKPAPNARPCAQYIERQVRGEAAGEDAEDAAERSSPNAP